MGANHVTRDSPDKRLWNGHILQEQPLATRVITVWLLCKLCLKTLNFSRVAANASHGSNPIASTRSQLRIMLVLLVHDRVTQRLTRWVRVEVSRRVWMVWDQYIRPVSSGEAPSELPLP